MGWTLGGKGKGWERKEGREFIRVPEMKNWQLWIALYAVTDVGVEWLIVLVLVLAVLSDSTEPRKNLCCVIVLVPAYVR